MSEISVAAPERLDFAEVYEAHFHEVERWIRALGGPDMDLEDLAQEVFIVVERKLDRFDGGNLRGWLFRICVYTVSDHRRRSWFKNLFAKRSPRDLEALASSQVGPAEDLERKENARRVHRVLERMSEKRRIAFTLYELNGHSGEEIAAMLDVPLKTVWTRLHHARKDFIAMIAEDDAKGGQQP